MPDVIGKGKLIWNGSHQAVRFPRGYHVEGREVEVRRVGEATILTPARPARWPRGYFTRLGKLTEDFEAPAL